MSHPALETEHVTVRYREVLALDDVTLTVAHGKVTGLIGMNGAGKSTLLNAVVGAVTPTSGQIKLEGGDPAAARRAGRVAFVPQSSAIGRHAPVTAWDIVATGRYPHLPVSRRLHAKDRDIVRDSLAAVNMLELAKRPLANLSGGQRQRVLVARAMAQEATLVLLDEPFAGLDAGSEDLLMEQLRKMAERGAAIIVSTHHLEGARVLCDDAILLRTRVLRHGSAREVLTTDALAEALGLTDKSVSTLPKGE
ncbi:metal ABC transporter ATP-binding protein [Dermabacteraceae bacterium P13115]|nr:metal ABC transporter ATP-binding protein [Dermabacteraceae bacterium TAE3-ERU5]